MSTNTQYQSNFDLDDFGPIYQAPKRSVWIKMFRDEFVTLFPDYQVIAYLGYCDNQYYFATRKMAQKYQSTLEKLRFATATLYGGITESGHEFFLPVYHPRTDDDQQYQLYMNRAKLAAESWVKINENSEGSTLTLKRFTVKAQPEPKRTLIDMLRAAFPGEYCIQDNQHSLLKEKYKLAYGMEEIEEIDD